MAPSAGALTLSPAELSYLHTSLSLNPPLRPDARTPTQSRSLVAETDILPSANGSARVCFADGGEAVAGVKAEVVEESRSGGEGDESWVEVTVDVPGAASTTRDDDALAVVLARMVREALVGGGELVARLGINGRFHWRIYVDIVLLSHPTTYPLPLLSMTTHLALRTAMLPALVSQGDEDPLFNDDWAAATPLYPVISPTPSSKSRSKPSPPLPPPPPPPPVTLLIAIVGSNALFDPSAEEVAAADALVAASVGHSQAHTVGKEKQPLRLLALRTLRSPSRNTPSGVPNALNTATGAAAPESAALALAVREVGSVMEGAGAESGVWRPPRGGLKREVLKAVVREAVAVEGVGWEILEALEAFAS